MKPIYLVRRHRPWPVIDTPGNTIAPLASAALMQPSHVLWAALAEEAAA